MFVPKAFSDDDDMSYVNATGAAAGKYLSVTNPRVVITGSHYLSVRDRRQLETTGTPYTPLLLILNEDAVRIPVRLPDAPPLAARYLETRGRGGRPAGRAELRALKEAAH